MPPRSPEGIPRTPLEVRERLVEALELDLVGPGPGHPLAQEMLPGWERPSNWYLTGFLIPARAAEEEAGDVDSDEEIDATGEHDSDDGDEDPAAAKRRYFPSSMGLSTLVAAGVEALSVSVTWGDYTVGDREVGAAGEDESGEAGGGHRSRRVWQRHPRERQLEVALGHSRGTPQVIPVPDSGGLELHVLERALPASGLDGRIPDGTRAVSLFLVNDRDPDSRQRDRAYAFQPELEVRCARPFVPRPDLRSGDADWDERVSDLHYADTPEFATGHAVSVDWDLVGGECRALRTRWIPSAEVERTDPAELHGVELGMEQLGALADGAAVQRALLPLVRQYRAWIESRRSDAQVLAGERGETAEALLGGAGVAARRIEQGIATLARDADALDAFRVANRAVAHALRRRVGAEHPAWRPFQLAFLLINLPGIVDPAAPERQIVDLLYFPTGGGKTEAYLGLAAFAIVLRRLRHPEASGLAGAGVTVMMRYTLRLLTLDQLSRAAGLVCALELERERDAERYGSWPFEIGLWVGKAATPNDLGFKGDGRSDTARARVSQYKGDPRGKPSPIPLEECPWCGTPFTAASFTLYPDSDRPRELRIVCANFQCDFTRDRPLPIVTIDGPIYRRLPAFLIATVDKFAALPWTGPSGALLGGATRHDANGFYAAAEPGVGTPLPEPLLPPDLVIQDELHLISGPLGTMAGLYETAIDGLCQRELGGRWVGPKIVASTATVRRAQDQIQALFARASTQVFPPPGPDRRDSFFAHTVPASVAPARRYLGVAAPGRNPKVVMRKVWLALMGAGERCYRDNGGHRNKENPADGYMTVVGYFNSLRELGGARRILEEEVRNTVAGYGARRRIGEQPGLFQDRRNFNEVVELTSRVSTDRVADARRRLGTDFSDLKARVDCALATNMISVGLDIGRLGLMGVLGQPKSAAEYIQATSRVGRSERAPGLVVTLLNVGKPRDRSHYERFRHFHETFYRSVEVGSVTPFSARALDRGFAGALVALARHRRPQLTPALGAERLAGVRPALEQELRQLFDRRLAEQPMDDAERAQRAVGVQERIVDLLDAWQAIIAGYEQDSVELRYQRYEGPDNPRPLLRELLDTDFISENHRKFRVARSLRDVEPSVNLLLRDLHGAPVD